MAKSKTKAELRAENELLRRHGIGANITKLATYTVKYGGIAVVAWMGRDSIVALAGKSTVADINVQARGGLDVNTNTGKGGEPAGDPCGIAIFVAFLVAFAGVAYGKMQAKLRRKVIERFHPFQVAAERALDPRRSSSKLTRTGETRPEDL